MPQGLEIRDENGNVVFDTTTRLGKIIGQIVVTGFGTGSVTVPNVSGNLFTAIQSLTPLPNTGSEVTITGNTIKWVYESKPDKYMNVAYPHVIFYGVY